MRSAKKADCTLLYINHCRELVKSGFICGGDLIWDGNYADFLEGELKKKDCAEFGVSISALGT